MPYGLKRMIKRVAAVCVAGAVPGWAQQEINAVEEGKKAFETYGCVVCHVVDKDDQSLRTGPTLHGLFTSEPRAFEVKVTAIVSCESFLLSSHFAKLNAVFVFN